jgi:hypothetical protein
MRRQKSVVTGSVRRPRKLAREREAKVLDCGSERCPSTVSQRPSASRKEPQYSLITELCDASPKLSRLRFEWRSLSLSNARVERGQEVRTRAGTLDPRDSCALRATRFDKVDPRLIRYSPWQRLIMHRWAIGRSGFNPEARNREMFLQQVSTLCR